MASLFDNTFGSFLDFDMEDMFEDIFGFGTAGNVIDFFTGFNPGVIGSGPGTQEARRMLERYEELKEKPYTYNVLDPTLPTESLIDRPDALEAIGYSPEDLAYQRLAEAPELDYEGYAAPSISGTQVGAPSGYDIERYAATLPSDVRTALDSAMRDRQVATLEELENVWREEGMTDSDRMLATQILQGQAAEASRGRAAALQNIRERGLEGTGMEAALTALGGQAGSEAARRSGIDVMREAQRRKDEALRGAGALAGDIRGTDISLSARNADVINSFNRANADAQTAAALRNAQLQTDKQRYMAEQQNLNARINAELANQVEQINAQYERDARKYGADQANRAREINLQNAIRVSEQNVALGNETALRNWQSRNQSAEYLANRQNEAARINLDNVIDTNVQNTNIQNQFKQRNAEIENAFKLQNQENLNKIEQLGNEFQLDRLKGMSGASKTLITQLNAEQKANMARKLAEELAKGGVGTPVPGPGGAGGAGGAGAGGGLPGQAARDVAARPDIFGGGGLAGQAARDIAARPDIFGGGPGGQVIDDYFDEWAGIDESQWGGQVIDDYFDEWEGIDESTWNVPVIDDYFDEWAGIDESTWNVPVIDDYFDEWAGIDESTWQTPTYDFPDYTEDYSQDWEYPDISYDYPDYTEDYSQDWGYPDLETFPEFTTGLEGTYDEPDYGYADFEIDFGPPPGQESGWTDWGYDDFSPPPLTSPGYAGGSYNIGAGTYTPPSSTGYKFDDTFNFFT